MIAFHDDHTIVGLSTDEKPMALNGTCFIELDTGKIYYFEGTAQAWGELGSGEIPTPPTPPGPTPGKITINLYRTIQPYELVVPEEGN